jgi:hypothetical protein
MTQLNLSGRQTTETQKKAATDLEDGSVKNQTVGALGALAMFAAVIVVGSCSRSSKPEAVQQPIQSTSPASAPAVAIPAPAPIAAPAVAKAKAKKRRGPTLSYVNRDYGVSFDFPRNYQLKTGKQAESAFAAMNLQPTNFVNPGGVTLAAVELPGNSYPGSDFKSASIHVSVNPVMTSEACNQFAFAEPDTGVDPSSTLEIAKVKIGSIEYSEVENSMAGMMKQADSKYYHAFNDSACYEFTLDVGTESDGNAEGVKPVDRPAVFGKLEKILATVKLHPAAIPEAKAPASSAKQPATDGSPNTQEQSAISPKL